MHFIFSRLVENVFELNLELTLSKADYPYHPNELYVYGYYRTVTSRDPPIARSGYRAVRLGPRFSKCC